MVWTKLFHIKSLPRAMQKYIPHKIRQQPHISLRYQTMLKKQFRSNGVPWIYDLKNVPTDPLQQKPKQAKHVIAKAMRIQRIQKALQESQAKQLQFRQIKLNSRNNKGVDKIIQKTLPSWIKGQNAQKLPAFMMGKKNKQQ